MNYNETIQEIVESLIKLNQTRALNLKLHTQLLNRLNTLNYLVIELNIENIPDLYRNMLHDCLQDLRTALKTVEKRSSTIFRKLLDAFYAPDLKHLQSFISRILEITDLLTSSLSINQYIERKLLTKRSSSSLGSDDIQNDAVEDVIKGDVIRKKVKVNPTENKETTSAAFSIKILYDKPLERYIEKDMILKKVNWKSNDTAEIYFNRADFLYLPNTISLRLSRQHAKVVAKKNNNANVFEVSDLGSNGIYYLQNEDLQTPPRNEGTAVKGQFKKVKKGDGGCVLKHGDIVGLIMKSGTSSKELLIGFQFLEHF